MTFTFRSRTVRTVAAGALTAALVSAGSVAAHAATDPSPKPTTKHSAVPKRASLTAEANSSTVKSGEEIRITGRSSGLQAGDPVTLQQEKNGEWTTLPAGDPMDLQGESYILTTRPTATGVQHYRVMSGTTYSPTISVTVE
ncbi:hypothetical protein ACIQGO_33120 [Streptomyces shenzhenensis]|uniref:hypothetical protein n=1 Tax=Streptomyces shenzhenensis TaxID=943815 RepID=UPI003802F55F